MSPDRLDIRSYSRKKENLRGIRKSLFAAAHPILEAASRLENKESEGKYRSIFQNNHTVMLLVDLKNWCVADANPAACSFYGYSREELVGKSISEINPLKRSELSVKLAEAMMKPRTKFYFSHLTSEGKTREVEVHTGPIRIGNRPLLYSIIHDVTEQKRIEGMVKRQSESSQLRAQIWSAVWSDRDMSESELMKKVMDSLAEFADADTVTFFRIDKASGNAIAEIECSRESVREENIGKAISASALADHRGKIAIDILPGMVSCASPNKGNGSKSCFLVPYGNENTTEGYLAFEGDRGKEAWERTERNLLNEMVRILYMRTEQIRLEASQHQNERLEAVGRLAGGIAHEFNNIMTRIMGYAEIIRRRIDQSHEIYGFAGIISSLSDRGAECTRRLLAFAREGKYVMQAVDIHDTIGEVIYFLEKGTANKGIRFTRKFNAESCGIEGEESLIHNALLNLGLNSRDSMPNGGEIAFETRNAAIPGANNMGLEPGNYIMITVRDNGAGMNEYNLKHAFEPSFIVRNGTVRADLGLASVYGTMKSHFGHVEIRSAPGKGTAVEIWLPVSEKRESGNEESKASAQIHSTVLVVDDEYSVRGTIAEMLKISGYEVRQCASGEEAIAFYRENWREIGCVLLDMKMPGLDGKASFKELKMINPDIRAMLITGYSLDGDAQDALKDGMVGYLPKPFKMETLIELVDSKIGRDGDSGKAQ